MVVRFIVLSGGKTDEIELDADSITVGRRRAGGIVPDVNLEWDMEVSRDLHCVVTSVNGALLIKDCASKNGTFIGNVRLESGIERELPFAEPVRTGCTIWTLIPAGWMAVRLDNVFFFGRCPDFLFYPLFDCLKFATFEFYGINTGATSPEVFHIKLEIPGLSSKAELGLRLNEFERTKLDISSFALDYHSIKSLKNPVKTALYIEITYGGDIKQFQKETVVMGIWDFPFAGDCWRAAAAYVSPFNEDICRIVQSAETGFRAQIGFESFEALLRSGEPFAERRIFEAIYEFLRGSNQWTYEDPETGSIDGIPFQKIRPINLKNGNAVPDGAANCFDLSVIISSCLEKAGLCPLVILLGNDGDPTHAVAGCWFGTAPGSRPVIDEAGIIQGELSEGNILIAESTGLIHGKTELAFGEARKTGEAQIMKSGWIRAVDVAALHPPNGNIHPVDLMRTGEFSEILKSSEVFAVRKKSGSVELTHLLFGLTAESGIFKTLLRDMGLSPQKVRDKLDGLEKAGTFDGEPTATVNFLGCIHMAEELARLGNGFSAGEQELVWSFLYKRRASEKLRKVCRSCGVDLDAMEKDMEKLYSRPAVNLTVSGPYRERRN